MACTVPNSNVNDFFNFYIYIAKGHFAETDPNIYV